jgi:2-iminoacetate synthase ThiH
MKRFSEYAEHVFEPVKAQTGCAVCGYARGHHPTARQLRTDSLRRTAEQTEQDDYQRACLQSAAHRARLG